MTRIQGFMLRRRPRRAAVLILVIVLLVLMALMGIAYMASARTDRAASSQNIINTQIELLVEGVRAIAVAHITHDVKPQKDTYRPQELADYKHLDSIVESPDPAVGNTDPYLAARAPLTLGEIAVANASATGKNRIVRAGANSYTYQNKPITHADPDGNPTTAGPLLGDNGVLWLAVTDPGKGTFANPARVEGVSTGATSAIERVRFFAGGNNDTVGEGLPLVRDLINVNGRSPMFPIEVRIGGEAMPGMRVYNAGGDAIDTVAADADGDGIADALLFDLGFEQNGVSYYAALRIIDNNSAVNLTTAAWRDDDTVLGPAHGSANLYYNFFPSNYDLAGLLHPDDDIARFVAAVSGSDRLPNRPDQIAVYQDSNVRVAMQGVQYRTIADFHWMRTGRRVESRGYNPAYVPRYHPYGGAVQLSDSAALARRFVLSGDTALAEAETLLPNSLRVGTAGKLAAYDPADVKSWYIDHFASVGGQKHSLRGMATARNPVSNATVVRSIATGVDEPPLAFNRLVSGGDLQVMPPYVTPTTGGVESPSMGVKANVNTDEFPALWQAFWSVMVGPAQSNALNSEPHKEVHDPAQLTAPAATDKKPTPLRAGTMFRDIDRMQRDAGETGASVSSMVLLRAALAAVNTIDLRDADDDVTAKEFEHTTGRRFRVYGFEPQPFLTECVVYKDWEMVDEEVNGKIIRRPGEGRHFVAVELFNPHERRVSLDNHALAVVYREGAGSWPRVPQPIMLEDALGPALDAAGLADREMAPGERIVLHSNPATLPDAGWFNAITAKKVLVPDLTKVVDNGVPPQHIAGELLILRTQKLKQVSDEEKGAAGLANRVPIDQIDLTGLTYPNNVFAYRIDNGEEVWVSAKFPRWYHYARPNDDAADKRWTAVHPGRYTPHMPPRAPDGEAQDPEIPREPKTNHPARKLRYERMRETDKDTMPAHALGLPDPDGTVGVIIEDNPKGEPQPDGAGEPQPALQVAPPDGGGAGGAGGGAAGAGGAAGGMQTFSIPLSLGGWPGPATTGGTNPAAAYPFGGFARNGDILKVPYIGRYRMMFVNGGTAQLSEMNSISMDAAYADDMNDANDRDANDHAQEQVGRFVPLIDVAADGTVTEDDSYKWTKKLLDYLSVETPHADLMPNLHKDAYQSLWTAMGNQPGTYRAPEPVANRPGDPANSPPEKLIGVEGLVNINTAPWQVIARLPLLPVDAGDAAREKLAKDVVAYRQDKGPFETLFDLNKVPGFADAMGAWRTTAFGPKHGDFSVDATSGTDGIAGDFEDRYMMMTRISNHVTTRSDSFTVYLVVQGWRDARTADARLVAQRRNAFIVDRTRLHQKGHDLTIRNVPQD